MHGSSSPNRMRCFLCSLTMAGALCVCDRLAERPPPWPRWCNMDYLPFVLAFIVTEARFGHKDEWVEALERVGFTPPCVSFYADLLCRHDVTPSMAPRLTHSTASS